MKFRITFMSLDLGRRVIMDVGHYMDKDGFMDSDMLERTLKYMRTFASDYPCIQIDVKFMDKIFLGAKTKSLFI